MSQALQTLEAMSSGGFSQSDVYGVIIILFILYVGFLITRPLWERRWSRLADKIFLLRMFRKRQAPVHR